MIERMLSLMRVPPGSLVRMTLHPRDVRCYIMFLICVVLPQPSVPSTVMKSPLFSCPSIWPLSPNSSRPLFLNILAPNTCFPHLHYTPLQHTLPYMFYFLHRTRTVPSLYTPWTLPPALITSVMKSAASCVISSPGHTRGIPGGYGDMTRLLILPLRQPS